METKSKDPRWYLAYFSGDLALHYKRQKRGKIITPMMRQADVLDFWL